MTTIERNSAFEQFRHLVLPIARSFHVPGFSAEDLSHEGFLVIMTVLDRRRDLLDLPRERAERFMRSCIRNCFRQLLRHGDAASVALDAKVPGTSMTFVDLVSDDGPSQLDIVVEADFAEQVIDRVSKLEPRDREIVEAYFGLSAPAPQSLRTIAAKLRIGDHQVRRRLVFALDALVKPTPLANAVSALEACFA